MLITAPACSNNYSTVLKCDKQAIRQGFRDVASILCLLRRIIFEARAQRPHVDRDGASCMRKVQIYILMTGFD